MQLPAWGFPPGFSGVAQVTRKSVVRAEVLSLAIHVLVIAVLLLPSFQRILVPAPTTPGLPKYPEWVARPADLFHVLHGKGDFGSNSGGGDRNPVPARKGELPKTSLLPLVPPMPIRNPNPKLAANQEVLGPPEIQPVSPPLDRIGLPWANSLTNSFGPGERGGLGTGCCGGVGPGDQGPGVYGTGRNGKPLPAGGTPPVCVYCPSPSYTDEARKVKLQGAVTLQVLVTAEGRPSEISIVKGLGMGLEERAREAVKGWRFRPATLTGGRPVAMWVTVEVNFRLL